MAQQDSIIVGKYTCSGCFVKKASVYRNKNNLCWTCLNNVPKHIPDEQVVRFAKAMKERRIKK